jgi:hypothetical protein
MTMGVVHIENIELFLTKIMGEVYNVTEMRGQKRGVIKFDGMIQSKSIRGLHSGLEDPLLNTVLQGERRFSIGKGDIMSPLLQSLTEVQRRIGRTGPLPVAEKMKDLHSIANPTRYSSCFWSQINSDGSALKKKVIILDFFKLLDVLFGTNKLL